MKKKSSLSLSLLIFVPALAVLAALLRAVLLLSGGETESEYTVFFLSSTDALFLAVLLSAAVFGALSFDAKKYLSRPALTSSLSVLFASGFLAVALLASAVYHFSLLPAAITNPASFFLILICALVSLAGMASFLFLLLPSLLGKELTASLALSAAGAVLPVVMALSLYFDREETINLPAKLLALLSFLALACFLLSECRVLLSERGAALHYFAGGLSFFFSFLTAVPDLLFTAVYGKEPIGSSLFDFLLLGYALYVLARLFTMLPKEEKEEHPMVAKLKETDGEQITLFSKETESDAAPYSAENAEGENNE